MWKLLLCINSIRCMTRNRCHFLSFNRRITSFSDTSSAVTLLVCCCCCTTVSMMEESDMRNPPRVWIAVSRNSQKLDLGFSAISVSRSGACVWSRMPATNRCFSRLSTVTAMPESSSCTRSFIAASASENSCNVSQGPCFLPKNDYIFMTSSYGPVTPPNRLFKMSRIWDTVLVR